MQGALYAGGAAPPQKRLQCRCGALEWRSSRERKFTPKPMKNTLFVSFEEKENRR